MNVLDYQIDTTGSVRSREEAIQDQAEIILQEWHDHIRNPTINDVALLSVSWVDMDDIDGSTGEVTTGSGTAVWPSTGASAAAAGSPNAAVLVHKNATVSRRKRNGRMYLAGIAETWTDTDAGNTINAATVTSLQNEVTSFLGNTNQEDVDPLDFQSAMVVTHTENLNAGTSNPPNIVARGFDVVDSLSVDPLLATQRRRLRP